MISFEVSTTKDEKVMVTCKGPPAYLARIAPTVEGNAMTFDCSREQFEAGIMARQAGAMIQDALPFLSADEREFLLSGMLPEQFMKLMGKLC